MALQAFIQKSVTRYYGSLLDALEGLSREELEFQPRADCMSIGFLVWHCARAHDFLVQTVMKGAGQLWVEEGWAERLGRGPANPLDTGFGFSAEQVQGFEVPPTAALLAYAEATQANVLDHISQVDDEALESIWVNGPAGGKLTLSSVYQQMLWELNQHIGQIAYLRGMQRGIEAPMHIGAVFEEAKSIT